MKTNLFPTYLTALLLSIGTAIKTIHYYLPWQSGTRFRTSSHCRGFFCHFHCAHPHIWPLWLRLQAWSIDLLWPLLSSLMHTNRLIIQLILHFSLKGRVASTASSEFKRCTVPLWLRRLTCSINFFTLLLSISPHTSRLII